MIEGDSISQHQQLQKQKIADSFEKGTYVDNAENKAKHRVGNHYGGEGEAGKMFMKKVYTEQADAREGRYKGVPLKFMDNNTYVRIAKDDYKLLTGDAKAAKLLADTKEVRDIHKKEFPKNNRKIISMFPKDIIQGRMKDMKSAIEKVVRKPKYGTTKKLQDYEGFRVISDSIQAVMDNVRAFKAEYPNIKDQDNYIDKSLDDYRSFHLIVEKNGVEFEIQFRTSNQHKFAEWSHNIYKPQNEVQIAMLKEKREEIDEYSHGMSEYYYSVDNGRGGVNPPPCTYVIKIAFGCL
jgi:ppGpp synthetase/RelA/SpoT-type nucleotidyltranferase